MEAQVVQIPGQDGARLVGGEWGRRPLKEHTGVRPARDLGARIKSMGFILRCENPREGFKQENHVIPYF